MVLEYRIISHFSLIEMTNERAERKEKLQGQQEPGGPTVWFLMKYQTMSFVSNISLYGYFNLLNIKIFVEWRMELHATNLLQTLKLV